MNVVDYKSIELSGISFNNPEKYKGSYICTGKYNNEDLYIQTPMMTNLDGIHQTDSRAHLDLYFDKTHVDFYDFLGDFDDNNIQTIFKKSQDWFQKTIPVDVLEDLYVTPLKHKNPPKFKLRIPLSKSQVSVPIIDIENTSVDAENIPNNCRVVALLKFIGLKFLKEQVSSEWVPVQIKVCEKVENKKESLIVLNSEAETEVAAEAETLEEDENIEEPLELEFEELPDDFDLQATEEDNGYDSSEEIVDNTEDSVVNEEIISLEQNNIIEEPIARTIQQEYEELKEKFNKREMEFNELRNVLKNYL
jgi:hypothetical protein